jgi:hypothetical protein
MHTEGGKKMKLINIYPLFFEKRLENAELHEYYLCRIGGFQRPQE